MGQVIPTIITVGLARMPQPLGLSSAAVAIELEVDLLARRITSVTTNLGLPGLDRLLCELLVGRSPDSIGDAFLELEVRYTAPFAAAVAVALKNAVKRVPDATPAARNAVALNGASAAAVPVASS